MWGVGGCGRPSRHIQLCRRCRHLATGALTRAQPPSPCGRKVGLVVAAHGSCSAHGTMPVARTLPRHGLTLSHTPLDCRQPCWCVLMHSVHVAPFSQFIEFTALARQSRGAGPQSLTFSCGVILQLSADMPPDASDEVSEHTSPRQVASPQV